MTFNKMINTGKEKYMLLFFSLDRKEPKDQGCKYLAKYFIRTTEKIKLATLRQKFSLFVVLLHILNAKYLRPLKKKMRGKDG
jgi:hypothetical protein